ncbi:YihY/virulence factor BrkB family protein [Sporolactobacillus sp. Y61]|uniref:YihY/virulence factor BrkB family protein n=1 Tax=Sporolactobacillus sp. Y61 TaxID=3160863 RepID=A0AAU8IFP5_9BACL|nr:YihY/virulence factor BrkB family protein [Sporolactobacillus sp. THM19-2]RYL88901.1 YihY/virulence factor BrkB family protein [Sporolactobacillus sp. THM19-2]
MEKVKREKEFKEVRLFIKLLTKRFIEDHTVDLAATLAFYFLLSLFPLVIFLFAILPYLGLTQAEIIPFLERYLPGEVMSLIEQNLNGVFTKSGGLLSLGVIATIWPASGAINALIRTLNRAYHVKETRPFILTRFLAMCFTLAMIFAIAMTLAVNVIAAAWMRSLFRYLGFSESFAGMWSVISTLVTFVVIIMIFDFLFMLAPNIRLKPGEVIIGAVIAGAGWQLASYAFSFYVRYLGNYTSTYGTLGGIIILMLWFYLTAFTIIIGGQINALCYQLHIGKGRTHTG